MKTLIIIMLALFSLHGGCQEITKYYDNNWIEVPVGKAVYYAKFTKEGSLYQCTSYWKDNNALRGRSAYPDTIMAVPEGLQLLYTKKGHIEDSIFFEDGKTQFLYHYYPNGQLAVHYHLPENKKEGVTEAWDEDGKKIKNFILMKEAEFRGGQNAWEAYIKKNTSKDLTIKGSTEKVTVNVQVEFIVDEEGLVSKQKIARSSGYKNIDNDALRAIAESPKWNSAILYNKPVKAYRIQPISYEIYPAKN